MAEQTRASTAPGLANVLRARYWTSAVLRIIALSFVLRFVWHAGEVLVSVPASILVSMTRGGGMEPLYPVTEFVRSLVWAGPAGDGRCRRGGAAGVPTMMTLDARTIVRRRHTATIAFAGWLAPAGDEA